MGILGSAYQALDRFLPFDKQLDPMFGNGILSQSNAGVSAMAPPAQMQPSEPGVMGFPAMPGPQGPQQAPQAPEKPFKPSLVDTIWGVAAGYSPNQARQMQVDAYAKRQAQQAQTQLRDSLPPEQQAIFDTSPELWAQYYGKPKEPERPQRFETPQGILEFGPDGKPTMAYQYPQAPAPEKPRARERGPDGIYEQQDDGTWKKVIGFGAAPRTFAPQRAPGGSRAAPSVPSTGIKWD